MRLHEKNVTPSLHPALPESGILSMWICSFPRSALMFSANPVRSAIVVAMGLCLAVAARADEKPKPLSPAVVRGLDYLAEQQHSNGGWDQGGGWRVAEQGKAQAVSAPNSPDVGNTCIAVLAFVRCGSTAKEGKYAKQIANGVDFACGHIARSDEKSLFVTEIKGTQLQSKSGPYVDTFLAVMMLAELKGKMPDSAGEAAVESALKKTVADDEKPRANAAVERESQRQPVHSVHR